MSNLDKLSRQLKAALKKHANAKEDYTHAQLNLSDCYKAVNDAAGAVQKLRDKVLFEAEGAETPNFALYV